MRATIPRHREGAQGPFHKNYNVRMPSPWFARIGGTVFYFDH